VLEELGQLKLSAGRYAQLRLVLAANGSGTPANSVLPADGEETALDIAAVERPASSSPTPSRSTRTS